MPSIKRKTLKDCDEYKTRVEEWNDKGVKLLFVHVELKGRVTKAMIEQLRTEFEEYKRVIKLAGYNVVHSYSATPKFYSMFKGWEEVGDMVGEFEGYKVIKWELN